MFLGLGKNLERQGLLIFMTSKGDPRWDPLLATWVSQIFNKTQKHLWAPLGMWWFEII